MSGLLVPIDTGDRSVPTKISKSWVRVTINFRSWVPAR